MTKEIGKDVSAQEDAVKVKYTFRDIYDDAPHKTYSAHGDKTYKQQIQQNFLMGDSMVQNVDICHLGNWDNPDQILGEDTIGKSPSFL